MTVILSVPVICLINPYVYAGYVVAGTIGVSIASYLTAWDGISMGTYINISVAAIMAIAITFSLYHLANIYYEQSDKLADLSHIDQLTHLLNRRSFDEELEKRYEKHQNGYCFLFADIDDFKRANDERGHAYGDSVLEQVGSRFNEAFPSHSYRYGGDEIAVISELSDEEMVEKLEAISASLASLETGAVHFSAGICRLGNETPRQALAKADAALYKAKANRKGEFIFFSESLKK